MAAATALPLSDPTRCCVCSGRHVADAQARRFVAELISSSGLANVTAKDVLVASAMEARGFLEAIEK